MPWTKTKVTGSRRRLGHRISFLTGGRTAEFRHFERSQRFAGLRSGEDRDGVLCFGKRGGGGQGQNGGEEEDSMEHGCVCNA